MPEAVHLLSHEFPPFTGGIGVYAEETAAALARADVLTTVWVPDYGVRHVDTYPFQVKRIGMRGKQDWICRMRFAKGLRRGFPDGRIRGTVVLGEPGPIRLWMYQKFMNLPQPDRLVVILHGSEVRLQTGMPHRRHLFRQLLRSADCIGVVSNAVGDSVLEHYPEVGDKVVAVSGAVRHAWQILPAVTHHHSEGSRDIIQVGRIHPRKGQHLLVEALTRLPPHLRESIRVRLIGPVGKRGYWKSLRLQIEGANLPVVSEGTVSEAELRAAYESASLLVMPSQPYRSSVEGLGLVLLEAQHFGCPVVGTRVGGVAEALQDGRTGFLVEPGNPEALAEAMARILEDPDTAQVMGRDGSQFVRENFSWDRNVRDMGLV